MIPYAEYSHFDGKDFTYYCNDHVPKDKSHIRILDDRIPSMKYCTTCKKLHEQSKADELVNQIVELVICSDAKHRLLDEQFGLSGCKKCGLVFDLYR